MQSTHDLWTFKVVGGSEFTLRPPGNPEVAHEGRTSIFHLTLTTEQANTLSKAMMKMGCQVEVRQMDGQTVEQHEERKALLGVGKQATVWPCGQCPTCFWFEPTNENPCGFEVWPEEMVKTALESHQAAIDNVNSCPIYGQAGSEGG